MSETAAIRSLAAPSGFFDGDWVESKDQDPEGSIRLLQLADIGDGVFRDRSNRWLNKEAFARLNCQPVLAGDILIARMPDPIGRCCVVPRGIGDAITVVDVAVLRVDHTRADARFAMYTINSLGVRSFITAAQDGATRQRIPRKRLGRTLVPAPSLAKQQTIADYLDRETQRIDELIAEQHDLVETLRVRRQAVIESSVFGLEKDVTRTARIEPWLPPLPATWEAMQLGFVTESQAGYAFPSEGFKHGDLGTRLLRGINVKPDGVDWSDRVTWDEEAEPIPSEFILETGDIVLGMDRPFVGAGIRVTVIREEDLPALLVQRVLRVRAAGEMRDGYLRYVLRTSALKHYLEPMFTGVSVPHISEWQVRKFVVPVPPHNEQRRISAYLDDQTSRIDALIAESEDLIALSQERRAALITAAVTGQIDVRTAA